MKNSVPVSDEQLTERLDRALKLAENLGYKLAEQNAALAPIVNPVPVSAEWVMTQAVQFEVLAIQVELLRRQLDRYRNDFITFAKSPTTGG